MLSSEEVVTFISGVFLCLICTSNSLLQFIRGVKQYNMQIVDVVGS
jgi:hypothetical protein